jgi:uncharacterized protein
MKPHTIVSICLLLIFFIRCSQEKKENVFSIGTQDSLYSSILDENRKFFVYTPPGYGDGSDSSKRFPVIYLLDGGAHFHSVTGLLDQLMGNALCPEMIVVAIENTDRSRDLTPSQSLKLPNGEERDFLRTTGGAENFVKFIEAELFAHVEKNYRTAPHRVLIGHSFGGLFAIHTMMNHPELFNTYIAIDPSLWWDDRKLLLQTDSVLRTKNFAGKSLFVSVANTMPPGMDTLRVSTDTTGNTSHIRSIIHFSKKASTLKNVNGMNFTWRYYNEDTHGSVPLISEYDALRIVFKYYRMDYDPEATPEKFTDHFQLVSKNLGYAMLPPENVVNERGYNLIQNKNFERARAFFELNIKNYPGSANAHDSMGDYFLAAGDTLQARDYFSKALAIKDTPSTREKMEQLKNER